MAQSAPGRLFGQTADIQEEMGHCAQCDAPYPLRNQRCPVDNTPLIALPSVQDDMLGRVLDGRFEIRECIGEGGMGTVYRAHQASVGRDVAVKVVQTTASPNIIKRFMQEARLASQLSHPNTVVIHDFGQTHDGIVYLVMEYLEGTTLSQRLDADGPFSPDELAHVGVQLCAALQAAHATGIVHRDLKPCNAMLVRSIDGQERIKVLDFGLAKLLSMGRSDLSTNMGLMGTPAYMAPEMIRHEKVDERCDLYALGCTLYELAAGHPPFVAETIGDLFAMHMRDTPPPFERSDLHEISDIISQLLRKEKEDRPVSAEEVRQALLPFSGSPILPTPVPPASTLPPFTAPKSNKIAFAPTLYSIEPAPSSSKKPIFVALGMLALGAVAFTAYALSSSSSENKTQDKTHPAVSNQPTIYDAGIAINDATELQAPVLQTQQTQTKASSVQLQFDSFPKSSIFLNGKKIGTTPLPFEVPMGTPIKVIFRQNGYHSKTQHLIPDSDQSISVTLRRRSQVKGPKTGRPKPKSDPEPIFR